MSTERKLGSSSSSIPCAATDKARFFCSTMKMGLAMPGASTGMAARFSERNRDSVSSGARLMPRPCSISPATVARCPASRPVYSGDLIEPAAELAEKGDIDYLISECLAERTIAIARQAKMKDPGAGYNPMLEAPLQAVRTEDA